MQQKFIFLLLAMSEDKPIFFRNWPFAASQ